MDLRIQAAGRRRPAIDVQLKATVDLGVAQAGFLPFRLSVKNYYDLRVVTRPPRVLVVLELPKHESRWMTVTAEELVLRRRAYWLRLQQEHDELLGQKTVSVCVLEHNLLDVRRFER